MKPQVKMRPGWRRLLPGAAVVSLVAALPAYGYLDPGTGSYFIQLILGGLLGGLFAVGLFWRRILNSVRRLFRPRKDDDRTGN